MWVAWQEQATMNCSDTHLSLLYSDYHCSLTVSFIPWLCLHVCLHLCSFSSLYPTTEQWWKACWLYFAQEAFTDGVPLITGPHPEDNHCYCEPALTTHWWMFSIRCEVNNPFVGEENLFISLDCMLFTLFRSKALGDCCLTSLGQQWGCWQWAQIACYAGEIRSKKRLVSIMWPSSQLKYWNGCWSIWFP